MAWTVLIYGMVPLIVFVAVDAFANMKWAVISAVVFAVGDVFLSYFMLDTWDPGSIAAVGLIVGLGWLSLRRKDELYVKLQPVFLGIGFALFVAYYQFIGTPILDRYLPMIKSQVPAEMRGYFDNPAMLQRLNASVTGMIFVFLVHAAIVAWAAYKASNVTWLLVRGVGFWVLLIVMSVGVNLFA